MMILPETDCRFLFPFGLVEVMELERRLASKKIYENVVYWITKNHKT